MPTIFLQEIYCYDPRGARDDVSLDAVCDGGSRQTVWGPQRMRARGRFDLRATAGIEFFDTATIRLTGDLGHDFGAMSFDRHSRSGAGEFYFPGELNARYRLGYRLDAMPAASTEGMIRLTRLTCNDAQGTHDEVTLRVNGIIVVGPMHEMRSGWHVDLDEEILFNSACTISLSETYGQDWSRSFTLRSGDYELGGDHHEFNVGGPGIAGDARYTLDYEMMA